LVTKNTLKNNTNITIPAALNPLRSDVITSEDIKTQKNQKSKDNQNLKNSLYKLSFLQ